MKAKLIAFKLIALLFVIMLTSSASSGQLTVGNEKAGAYGGSISATRIEQNSEIEFTGSVYNFDDVDIYFVNSMNITFLEILGQSTNRDPKIYNISKDANAYQLHPEETYSDTLKSKVGFNAGKYNVSIGFILSNGSLTSSNYFTKYALGNLTVQIVGVSESQKVLRSFFYTILTIIGIVFLFWFYSKFIKR